MEIDLSNLYNHDLERTVLGTIMTEPDTLFDVYDILTEDCFHNPENRKMWQTINYLNDESRNYDMVTITSVLTQKGKIDQVGGAINIAQMTNTVGSTVTISDHARELKSYKIRRDALDFAKNVREQVVNGDINDILNTVVEGTDAISDSGQLDRERSTKEMVMSYISQVEKASQNDSAITGVPAGYSGIDEVVGGWQPTDLVIVAARPGMGKTGLGLCFAQNAVKAGYRVGFASCEMGGEQLIGRLIAQEYGESAQYIRRGQGVDFSRLQVAGSNVMNDNLVIWDNPYMSIYSLRTKAKREHAKNGLDMLIIDYLQILSGKQTGNREQEISSISRGAKALAKELNIPVIALSQLGRGVESRPDKKPLLSDLRESGAIEQDADIVSFVYRPEYYGIQETEDGESTAGLAYFNIAKHRNGALKSVKLHFKAELTKFSDPDAYVVPENYSNYSQSITPDEKRFEAEFGNQKDLDF